MAKAIKQIVTRCKECGATSDERFLKKIKGTTEYICEYCDLEDDYEDEYEGKVAKASVSGDDGEDWIGNSSGDEDDDYQDDNSSSESDMEDDI
ncbi:MAG: hypothetical protein OHK0038_05680 [Flammeovirgaceae bacterium]